MKRKTLVTTTFVGLFLVFVSIAQDQDLLDNRNCITGSTNAQTTLDALYASQGKSAPNPAQRRKTFERVIGQFGIPDNAYSQDEEACMFLRVFWRDTRDRYESDSKTKAQSQRQAAIDNDVANDLADFDG